ncbi:MAG: SMC family ATPase [Gammaproteobacteria bacterium]|nr:SMC family ATPase [Gammaproteobacteria bacterium]
MRYSSFKADNMGPFKSIEIDFDAIDGTLIAIAGGNGAGKSTLLEMLTGGLAHRACRTRGTLAHLATDRNSFIEGTVINGQTWTIRHNVDCVSGKGESLILDAEGVPVLDDGKVSSFDVWAKDNLPLPAVMYASAVSVQQDRGFLALGRSDRMAVLLRVIGAERLEKLAKAARDKGSAVATELDALRGRFVDAEAHALDVKVAQVLLTACEDAGREKQGAAESAREALRRAELLAVDSLAAQEIRDRRKSVVFRMDAAKRDMADNEERSGNNRALIVDADAIRAAVAKDAELIHEDEECQAQSDTVKADKHTLEIDATTAEGKLSTAIRDQVAATDVSRRAKARLEDKPIVDAAAGALEKDQGRLTAEKIRLDALKRAMEALRSSQLTHKDDRIDGLRSGLDEVAESADDAREVAEAALEGDDRLVLRVAQLPTEIEAGQRELQEASDEWEATRGRIAELTKQASRAVEMKSAAEDLERSDRNITDLQAVVDENSPIVAKHQDALEAKTREAAIIRTRTIAIRDARLAIEKSVSRAKHLDQAEARIEELTLSHAAMTATYAQLEAELAGLPEAKDGDAPDIKRHKREVAHAEDQSSHAAMSLGEARARLLQAEEDAERIAKLKTECAALEEELADWKKLAADLGKNGLQSLEVDAAVPTLNTMVNDILTSCVGTRFAVEFRTDRLIAGGKEQREALDVRVIDNMKGRDALAETYSGGECSIVGEAVALGLTLLGCECAGTDDVTLVRDETSSALDPENRESYLRMLRHAAKMVGARHVLFVSHDAAMIEAADARILIDDQGNVTVDGTD